MPEKILSPFPEILSTSVEAAPLSPEVISPNSPASPVSTTEANIPQSPSAPDNQTSPTSETSVSPTTYKPAALKGPTHQSRTWNAQFHRRQQLRQAA